MTNIAHYLYQTGATTVGDFSFNFGEKPEDYATLVENAVAVPLVDRGFLSVMGEKGAQLLQGQVTCDITQLTENTALLGAQCTPQGRMIALFRAFQLHSAERLLQMPASLVDTLAEYMAKYAVFFQTKLVNVSSAYACFGITGAKAAVALKQRYGTIPEAEQVYRDGNLMLYRISADQYGIIIPSAEAETLWKQLLDWATPAGSDFWTLQSIQAGLGEVTATTSGEFIPQMLNLQAINGISFKKGCYTGQEIVARTKYRGKLKKRLYRFEITTDTLPVPGTPCRLPDDQDVRVGEVVSAAWKNAGQAELLLVLNNTAATTDQLVLGEMSANPCQQLPLPYLLDE